MWAVTFAYEDGDNATYIHDTREGCVDEVKGTFDARKEEASNWKELTNSANQMTLQLNYADGGIETIIAVISHLYS